MENRDPRHDRREDEAVHPSQNVIDRPEVAERFAHVCQGN